MQVERAASLEQFQNGEATGLEVGCIFQDLWQVVDYTTLLICRALDSFNHVRLWQVVDMVHSGDMARSVGNLWQSVPFIYMFVCLTSRPRATSGISRPTSCLPLTSHRVVWTCGQLRCRCALVSCSINMYQPENFIQCSLQQTWLGGLTSRLSSTFSFQSMSTISDQSRAFALFSSFKIISAFANGCCEILHHSSPFVNRWGFSGHSLHPPRGPHGVADLLGLPCALLPTAFLKRFSMRKANSMNSIKQRWAKYGRVSSVFPFASVLSVVSSAVHPFGLCELGLRYQERKDCRMRWQWSKMI